MQPLHAFILVEPIEPPERSIGGIVIPDVAKDKHNAESCWQLVPADYSKTVKPFRCP